MKFDNNKLTTLFSNKKKRKMLTRPQQIYFWENPRIYQRTCSICQERITRIPDVELDNTGEFSEENNGLMLTHKVCNRARRKQEL